MPRNAKLTDAQLEQLRDAARDLPEGRRAAFVREQADLLGCAPSTIYRALEKVAPVRTRQRRSDAGAMRAMNQETFLDLAAFTARFDFEAELAIDTYNANRAAAGLPSVDCHPETLRRHLRQKQVSRRHNVQDLRVHRAWEAPYSNHTHQIDSTQAHCYYIDRDSSIGHEPAVALNKNKPGNERPRVWMIGMVDDYSRLRWGRFFTSEAGQCWWALMERAWRKPADTSVWPAYGMPQQVYSDCGTGYKSSLVRRTMGELGVEYRSALPSTEHETNAQAKGKIERALQLLQLFEKLTKMRRFDDLEEMNRAFEKFLVFINRRVHARTGQSPFHRWLAGMHDRSVRLLPPPEVTARMAFDQRERLVSKTLEIRLESQVYQLPRRAPFIDFIGQKVMVEYRRHDLSRITVILDREEHEIEAVVATPDVAGEWKSAPVPDAVKLKRELLKRDISHFDPHLVHDYRLARTEERFAAQLDETPHPLAEAAAAVRMIRRGKAQDRLAALGLVSTPPSPADRAALDALFGDRPEIPEPELSRWIAARQEDPMAGTATTPTLALA
ncbi:hypothetical protein [Longimicrobium sp.]|uniref:hypothetical protein n=1 Tax=Longimicrobium sp. TaxID=2029185 RepID=UPI002E37A9A6|nr:hypothetical protein [Longimicrobium sp.]HEX6038961.1 hypothetical protein [Longimicrobium sp.]